MKGLIRLLGTFRRLANQSRFVFVPGPNDLLDEDDAVVAAAGGKTSSHREAESAPVRYVFIVYLHH